MWIIDIKFRNTLKSQKIDTCKQGKYKGLQLIILLFLTIRNQEAIILKKYPFGWTTFDELTASEVKLNMLT